MDAIRLKYIWFIIIWIALSFLSSFIILLLSGFTLDWFLILLLLLTVMFPATMSFGKYWGEYVERKFTEKQIESKVGEVVEYKGYNRDSFCSVEWNVLSDNEIIKVRKVRDYLFIGNCDDNYIKSVLKTGELQRLLSDDWSWVDKEKYNVHTIEDWKHVKKGSHVTLNDGSKVFFHNKLKKVFNDNQ